MIAIPLVDQFYNRVPELLRLLREKPETYWLKRGARQTLKLFRNMAERVPAYRDFLKKNKVNSEKIQKIADLKGLPPTSKENYLLAYPLESLSWDGKIKELQWTISSTSGSTGEPFYFPRSRKQDKVFAVTAEACFLDFYEIQKHSTLFLNCFALGVWIGGIFMYQAAKYLMDKSSYSFSIINVGADKKETLKAVSRLGSNFEQVILGGYAPLVKDLLDEGIDQGLSWSDYNIKFFFAAEGFTESFRDYISKRGGVHNLYASTLNHYGTADLGTMAQETPFAIFLRRTALKLPKIRQAIFCDTNKEPTLCQYIPELFYFEAENGELFCSAPAGMPLMRYDLKDQGNVINYETAVKLLSEENIEIAEAEEKSFKKIWRLPFVYVSERSDLTASIYSVNVYPETIKKALQTESLLNWFTGRFTMKVDYDKTQNQQLEINIELKDGIEENEELRKKCLESVIFKLNEENSEWRDFYSDESIRGKIIPRIVLWPKNDPKYFNPKGKQKWVEGRV